eukprot:680270-Prorocentrum_minimum.AAC.1
MRLSESTVASWQPPSVASWPPPSQGGPSAVTPSDNTPSLLSLRPTTASDNGDVNAAPRDDRLHN